jgi:hypothetical protein
MGMYDTLRCKYPLPAEGANDLEYQTKSTPAQGLDEYEIREDGTLWYREYDVEWVKDEEYSFTSSVMARMNLRWEQVEDFTAEIRFYHWNKGRIEFSAYFVKGQLKHLELIEDRRMKDVPVQPGAADAASERGHGCPAKRDVRPVG